MEMNNEERTANVVQAEYTEGPIRLAVDVLADRSTDDAHAFDLRRTDTGQEFAVFWKKNGGYCIGRWQLRFQDGRCLP
ncbi:MAG: hypothetical protein LC131_06750 [Anaerolineae bacterium]|nr:hypothetical protein [Anaerolineae bacterium]GIK44940.1 MAG: hypothetical protein BroJett012_08430 [Betaproteobacteria bacterium]